VRREIVQGGILPFSDPVAPSLVSIVAGEHVSGSWWGHPAGQSIYQVAESLEAAIDVAVLKLWKRKQTLIHRRLWPALVRVGAARSAWQLNGLTEVSRRLLAQIDRLGSIRSDQLPIDFEKGYHGYRTALRALEGRMLVCTRSVHTNTGAHALEGESWASWAARTRTPKFKGSVLSAERLLEEAAQHLTPETDSRRFLPWGR
jgi:hypothetical protein